MTAMTKRELRSLLRSRHEGMAVRDAQSAALCRHILQSPEYKSAHLIGGYMPLSREADVTPVLLDALQKGKRLALPLCGQPPCMTLRLIASLDELVPGAYGILEPDGASPVVSAAEVDLLLVPLEGIDGEGFRLGKGGGYYDRLLADAEVTTIGCALSWQWTERVPRDSWDKPLAACADHCGLRYFNDQLIRRKEIHYEEAEDREGFQALSEG